MKVFIQFCTLFAGLALYISGAYAQNTLVVQPGQPTLDGIVSQNEWTSTPMVTARGVTLHAMADGDYLYIAASWADNTQNASGNRITFDGTQWTQSGDEDRIAFLFDMGQTGGNGANCQSFCHFPSMSTNGGIVDVWNWQAARSNPMGYAEDDYWDAAGQKVDEGVTAALVNELDLGLPTFMASSDPGAIKEFLVENAGAMNAFNRYGTLSTQSIEEAVSFNASMTFNANDYVAGYVHRVPSGDVADVHAAGRYNNGSWTVEFKRAYDGGEHDFTVSPGGSVSFTHEVFDNQGSNHAFDSTPLDVNIYTLDFSAIATTSIERSTGPVPALFELEQNYPNPFNSSTTFAFNIPEPGMARLEIVNILGQLVAVPMNEWVQPGQYRFAFNAEALPSGIYYYRLITDRHTDSRQMTLLE